MEDKKKDVTIYDLAQELKVSPSTVSRALNNHHSIGKKTKKAVQKLAKERGYRVNSLASALRTNRSKTFGIMVSWINRPFISSLISGVENAAREAGYRTIICQSHDDPAMEEENIQALHDSRISALIISLSMKTTHYEHFETLRDSGIPIVFVDRTPDLKNQHRVKIDNFQAAYEATEHLIQQGCQRIAHYGGSQQQSIYQERRSGYIKALEDHDIPIDDAIVIEADHLSAEEGTRLTEQILAMDVPPDGLFCANDTSAVSALQCAKRHGLNVPDDLAIIGFNNDPLCEIVTPMLSSVDHPAVDMGKVAVEQALKLLDDNSDNDFPMTITLPTDLKIRESTLRKKA